MTETELTAGRWWQDRERVHHKLAGVFEGGGAKGVAYLGALEVTLEMGCWFGAVAGASAGAITATLIAAGLTPKEIGIESQAAFAAMAPDGRVKGLMRLREDFGFFDESGLRLWLETLLQRRVTELRSGKSEVFDPEKVTGPITFSDLYEASGIELNVVAADISLGRQIIFSHLDTPHAQVTDAVLASSAIPFAFGAQNLRVETDEGTYSHTLVDGGVWANFPTFVFLDPSFRLASGRPREIAEDHVVGYLLDEASEEEPTVRTAYFAGYESSPVPYEWRPSKKKDRNEPATLKARLGRLTIGALMLALTPIRLALRFGAWAALGGRSPAWSGRWPSATGPWAPLLRMINDSLAAFHSAWFAVPAGVALVIGSVISVQWWISSFFILRLGEIQGYLAEGSVPVSETLQAIAALVIIALILAATVLALAAIVASYLTLGAVRQTAFGLGRTLAAGPGAPAWAGMASEDNVIRLPIPEELTTLSFDPSVPEVAAAIKEAHQKARQTTAEELQKILSGTRTDRRPGPAGDAGGGAPIELPMEKGLSEERAPVSSASPPLFPLRTMRQGWSFCIRLSLAAIVLGTVIWIVNLFVPESLRHRYETQIRICRQAMAVETDPCDPPSDMGTVSTAVFGPRTEGHEVQVVIRDNRGEIVADSGIRPGIDAYQTFSAPIRFGCGTEASCKVIVQALVDGQEIERAELSQTKTFRVEHR